MEEADARDGSEPSALPSHIADQGSDRGRVDVSLGRRESASTEIQEIDEALERIRDGSFGLCENCDKPIVKGRLEAIPYARLCLPLQGRRRALTPLS
jgi:RNA polymerase-binding transcription factor DksA